MRRVAIGLAMSLALLPVASAKAALVTSGPEFIGQLSGQITYSWHGDPALGCAAAGVCDVSGSLTYPAPDATIDAVNRHGRLLPGPLSFDSIEESELVRVRRDSPPDPPGVCLDTTSVDFLLFSPTPLGRGLYAYDIQTGAEFGGGFSSGRCAGPVEHDLADVVPSGKLRVGRQAMSLDMTGTRSFRAGAFSGQVVSTLRGRLRRAGNEFSSESSGGALFGGRPHRRSVTLLQLGLDYRLVGVDGELVTSFSGLASPLCDLLDACGITGTMRYTPLPSHGIFDVVAERILHGRLPDRSEAMRELRAGRLHLGVGDVELGRDALARVSEMAGRSGGQPCSDTQEVDAAPLDASGHTRSLFVRLGPPGFDQPDAFRTRCGGPAQADVVGGGSLATGRISAHALGGRRLDIPLGAAGAFATSGYAGTRSGRVVLHLVLRAAQVQKLREPVGP